MEECEDITDYKIHCFNTGEKVILVCKNRNTDVGLTEDFFSAKWEHIDIRRPEHPNDSEIIPPPSKLNEMLELADKLSKGFPFVRTDFYQINDKVYFGELTLFPAAGVVGFIPSEWDVKLGEYLDLNC